MVSTPSGWLSFLRGSFFQMFLIVFTFFHSGTSCRKGHLPAEAFPSEKAQLRRRFCGPTLWSVGSLLSLLGLSPFSHLLTLLQHSCRKLMKPWSIIKLKLAQGILRIVGSQGYSFFDGQTSGAKVCITRIVGVASRRCPSELNQKWPKAGCSFSLW